MPYYVVLRVEEEDEAKELVKGLLQKGEVGVSGASNVHNVPAIPRAVYRIPTKFCDPSDGHRGARKTHMGWTRGRKWGWLVCSICGKPTSKWGNGFHWFATHGINLLPFSKIANEDRHGWTSSGEWSEMLDLLGGKPE